MAISRILGPKASISLVTKPFKPCPIERIITTAATPITMPKIEKKLRNLLAFKAVRDCLIMESGFILLTFTHTVMLQLDLI